MPNNIEKFRIPQSMQQKDITEGLAEYEETVEEINKTADEIIDLLYSTGGLEHGLAEDLREYPKGIRDTIFLRLFERDPEEALLRIESFDSLPSRFQKDIARRLQSKTFEIRNFVDGILQVFDKITDKDLHKILIKNGSFETLAKNKEKLPYVTDEQILAKAHHADQFYRNTYWFDWKAVIPYIDEFPSVDKQQAIEGVLKQNTDSRPGVLIEHREKLGVSIRDLIDKFCQYKMSYELCRNLKYIDPEYHQEIADRTIQEKNVWAILQNAKDFQQIDVSDILKKITEIGQTVGFGSYKDGLGVILSEFNHLPATWIAQMPQELIDAILKRDPTKIAYRVDEFGDKIDRHELTRLLFEQKQLHALLDMAQKLGQERDDEFVIRIIDAGGTKLVIEQIEKFSPHLSRAVYQRLLKEDPERVALHIMCFDGITKEDVYYAVSNIKVKAQWYVAGILVDSVKIEGLQLNQEFAGKLIEGGAHTHLVISS